MKERDPSLHLRLSQLKLVIKDIAPEFGISRNYTDLLAVALLNRGKHLSCSNRSIKTDKKDAKVDKLLMSSRDDAGQFSLMLHRLRKSHAKHQGIKLIMPGSRDWPKVKEITGLANDFCKEFGLPIKQGYKEFIILALDRLGRGYALNKIPSISVKIYDTYRAKDYINQDLFPHITKQLFEEYCAKLSSIVGVTNGLRLKEPENYIYFVEATKVLVNYPGVKPKQYIEAQFQGLEFAKATPSILQLSGDGAITRLTRYMVANNIKANSQRKVIDWDKIRRK